MPAKITEAFVAALPKTDLHVHLDGSLRIKTLIELAREYNVKMPSYTEEGLRELVFKDRYANLAEYLHGFAYTVKVLQTEVALERTSYELAVDNYEEGVRYLEVRFAPQLHIHDHMNAIMVMKAVNRGLQRAQNEYNSRPAVREGREPAYGYGIIVCAMRMFRANFSEYFATLIQGHQFTPDKELYAAASLELARAAVIARDEYGLPIVGFDLAGEEAGYPAGDHAAAYHHVHQNFMKKTVHAGEAYGPESIFQAITSLHADRIGHGTYLLEPDAITDPDISDPERYVRSLGQYIADRRITLEVCLTSNLQTNPKMKTLADHTLSRLREHRLSTTICTDNRTISNTTVTKELMLAVEHLKLDHGDLKSILVYGFKRSFMPGTYLEKRRYVRQIIDFYESVEARFFGADQQGQS
ncbi:adenosine deaminase family protein [Myxococcota bacterium]|nr:adenosine deaminase family protein [Myxococcota bacterium]MBU1432014.1 adenosine deaminase family protein [Myxococcota bacterium]MBU1899615.1 adenosine deaminase family protein [Myxococcota bacterium]